MEGYFKVHPEISPPTRLFQMLMRLPIELQMIVCLSITKLRRPYIQTKMIQESITRLIVNMM